MRPLSRDLVMGLCTVGLLAACGVDGPAEFGDDDDSHGGTGGVGGNVGGGHVGGTGSGANGAAGGGGGVVDPFAVYGVGNRDDDDGNGNRDWNDTLFGSDNDITVFKLPADHVTTVLAGDNLEMTLSGDTGDVRMFHGGNVVLGDGTTQFTLSGADADDELQFEFSDFYVQAQIAVRHLDGGGAEQAAFDLTLMSAPLIQNHHGQPAEHVWAVGDSGNSSMLSVFQSVLGSKFTVINSSDVWVQDELEWATATAPNIRLNIAMDSIRDRALDAWVKGLKAPDVQPITWGQANTDTTEDKFGNLEATPPVTVNGTHYPNGRIYYGDNGSVGPTQVLTSFLDSQKIQKPIKVDIGWLCIGHVDEFISFIPDASSPKGFKLLYADVTAAYALLDSLPGATSLPRYQNTHGYGSISSLRGDSNLRSLNQDVQDDYLDPVLAHLKSELDLQDSDIIRIPSLFERISFCSYSGAYMEFAALIPGMINLTVVNVAGETPHLFVPDPYLRSNSGDQSSDPLIAAFRNAMPAEYEVHFVDDWYTYHVSLGEVHCGTNVSRTPHANWWTEGMHLLGGAQ